MKKIIPYISSTCLLMLPFVVFGAAAPTDGAITNPIKVESISQIMSVLFKVLVQLGAVAVTLAIIYSGFLFVAARGNPEELKKAKTTLFWTILGSLVLLGAQIISSVIENSLKSIQ